MKFPRTLPARNTSLSLSAFFVTFCFFVSNNAHGQFVYFESFRDSTAPGWTTTQGNSSPGPRLTADATPTAQDPEFGDPELDIAGNGWMRLATTTNTQDNNVYLDTSIPSSANEITISFDFTAWDRSASTGADGISVFLWDADVAFEDGADGGSLSYAQKTGDDGLDGAYVGVGLDVWGNFSNATEGRTGSDPTQTVGGVSENPGQLPNQVVVRGPDDSASQDGSGNYYYLAGTGGKNYTSVGDDSIQDLVDFNPGNGNLAFPNQDFRPDQDATQYRRFQMTLDGNDQLTVFVEFGFGTGFIELYTVDLSTFTRPENLRIGFGSATGGVNQVYEVRNLLVTADGFDDTWYWTDAQLSNDRLWSSGTNWTPQTVPGEGSNLYADVVFSNEFSTSPLADAIVTVDGGDKTLGSIFFSGEYGFTLDSETNQEFIMDTDGSGASEINVLNNPQGNADHTINPDLDLQNQLEVNNLVSQTLTFNGDVDTNGNDIIVDSVGTTEFSGVISEGADITKDGNGLLVLSGNNTYTGTTTVTNGIVQVENNNGLGNSNGDTVVQDGGSLALANGVSIQVGESIDIAGAGEGGIGALTNTSGSNTWQGEVDLADDATIGAQAGTLNFNAASNIDAAGFDLTFSPDDGATIDVARVITDSSGTSNIIVDGEGTTIFDANNNYSGVTTVNSGTLQIENSGALGDTGNDTVVNDGGTLAFNGSFTVSGAETYTITGEGAAGKSALWSEGGTNEIDGEVTITGGSATFGANSGATLRVDGGVAGVGQDAIIEGDGTVVWKDPNSYTGDTIIRSGTLLFEDGNNRIADVSDVIVEAPGLLDMNNRSDTVGSVAGAGDIDLGNATLTAGGNDIDTTFSGDISGSGDFVKQGTGTMTFSGSNTFTGELSVQQGTVELGADDVFDNGMDLRMDGGTFATDGFEDTFDNLLLDSNSAIDFLGTTGGYLTFDDASRSGGTLTIDNWAGSLTGNGNTRLQITDNDPGGGFIDNVEFTGWGDAELINLGSGLYEVVPTLDDFYIWNNDQGNERWDRDQNWEGNSGFPNSNGAKVLISDLDPTLDGGEIELRNDNTRLGIMVIDNDDTFTFTGNNSNRRFRFNNNGSQAVISTLGSTTPTFDREIQMQDDLLIQHNSTGTLSFTDSNSGFDILTGGNTLTFDGSGNVVVDSQITQGGAVVKNGLGTLELNDNNSFSGGFTQNSGTTLLGNNNAVGSGTLTINGGTLAASGANRSLNETYVINDDFTVGNDDNRDLTFTGNGTLAAGQQSITVESGIDFTVAGDLNGSGGFVKEGDGTTIFTADNSSFSGGLTVNDGTIQTTVSTDVTLGGTQTNQNYFGTGDVTIGPDGTMNITASDNSSITVASGGLLTNAGNLTYVSSDDFNINGDFTQTGGTSSITVSDDIDLAPGSTLDVSGGIMTLNPADQFTTSGGGGLVSVTNDAILNVDISAAGGSENNFFLNQADTLTVDGASSKLNITGEGDSDIDLDGRVNLTNGGELEVFAGETNLRASTILDGGAPGSAGTLTVHGDLNVQNPGLANAPNITINADSGDTQIASISGTESIENIGTLRKTGPGTTTINANVNNIQAQNILIDGGTLLNGDSDQIENLTPMELAGGVWNTGGNDEVLGTLTLSDNSRIDLASGDSIINYANSASEAWAGGDTLFIDNWSGNAGGGGIDQLYFGTTSGGLTSDQLAQVFFKDPFGDGLNYSAQILSTGEVVPLMAIPEPSTYAFGAVFASLLAWRERRRLRKLLTALR